MTASPETQVVGAGAIITAVGLANRAELGSLVVDVTAAASDCMDQFDSQNNCQVVQEVDGMVESIEAEPMQAMGALVLGGPWFGDY